MDGLALKIFWSEKDGSKHQEWAVLPKEIKISIERNSPIFNESGTFSYPFSIPYDDNRHIFGELKLPESERRIDEQEYTFELYCKGIFLFMGDISIKEGEINESIGLQLRSGNNTFMNKIADMNCRNVEQAEDVIIGENEYVKIEDGRPSGSREGYWRKIYNSNVAIAYPEANYCNVRIIGNPTTITEDNKEKIYVPIKEPSDSGICFYVMYLLECVFTMFRIGITKNEMGDYEDFMRLAFFVTSRKIKTKVIDSEHENLLATSANFPNIYVQEVIEALKNAFGIVFINDEFSSNVSIKLLKNILLNHEVQVLNGKIINVDKINENKKNIIVKYGSGDDTDTTYNYNDLGNVIEIENYNKIVDMHADDSLKDDDVHCYIDLRTGNAYRVKVDEETNTNASIFEVGQFNSYESIINEKETENQQEILIGFTPVIINDITNVDVQKQKDYKIENAIYIDVDIKYEAGSIIGRPPSGRTSQGSATTRAAKYENNREHTFSSASGYANFDVSNYDTGFTLGIMRGPGSDEIIDDTITAYRDEIGGNSFVKIAGTMAFTSDSIDVFGRDYDYNGASGGTGGDPLNKRFSLKLKATKPGYSATSYPDRGLVDTFLKEYLYFLQNRRTIKITANVSLSELIGVEWDKKYNIGEYCGFINKMSFDIDMDGISFTEIELYMI